MIGLDTNVLVRYLVQDDPVQSKKASLAIQRISHQGNLLHINRIVLCELVWVLSGAYALEKSDIVNTLEKILAAKQFDIESKEQVWLALSHYKSGKADFSDALIGAGNKAAGCDTTITFDKKAAMLETFEGITS